jgi:hypothetical protein
VPSRAIRRARPRARQTTRPSGARGDSGTRLPSAAARSGSFTKTPPLPSAVASHGAASDHEDLIGRARRPGTRALPTRRDGGSRDATARSGRRARLRGTLGTSVRAPSEPTAAAKRRVPVRQQHAVEEKDAAANPSSTSALASRSARSAWGARRHEGAVRCGSTRRRKSRYPHGRACGRITRSTRCIRRLFRARRRAREEVLRAESRQNSSGRARRPARS